MSDVPSHGFELNAQRLPVLVQTQSFQSFRTIGALCLREMATTYGRSPGGWLWAIIEPLAAIMLLSFIFSIAFRAPPLGLSFPLFYASGYLPFVVFHELSQKTATSLRFSKPLLNFGVVTLLDAILARLLLNTLTYILVLGIVLSGFVLPSDSGADVNFGRLILACSMAFFLAAGVGILNCYLFSAFPAWERLWAIAMRPMFIVSGVIFLLEDVPLNLQPIAALNPLFHVTGAMRSAIYSGYEPEYLAPFYVFGIALVSAVFGLLLLRNFQNELRQS